MDAFNDRTIDLGPNIIENRQPILQPSSTNWNMGIYAQRYLLIVDGKAINKRPSKHIKLIEDKDLRNSQLICYQQGLYTRLLPHIDIKPPEFGWTGGLA